MCKTEVVTSPWQICLPCVSFKGCLWLPKLKVLLDWHTFSLPTGPTGVTSKRIIPILCPPFSGHCLASGHHPLLTRLCQLLLVIYCSLIFPHKFIRRCSPNIFHKTGSILLLKTLTHSPFTPSLLVEPRLAWYTSPFTLVPANHSAPFQLHHTVH